MSDALEWSVPGLFIRYEFRSAIRRTSDVVTETTAGGIRQYEVGPNLPGIVLRGLIPNLFITTRNSRDADLAKDKQLKDAQPRL